MNRRRQALQFCLDPAVVVVIQICNEFLLKVFHGLKFLQVQQFALERPKEIFYHSIVQTVPFPAHALLDAFLSEHPLILFMLVLPALVGLDEGRTYKSITAEYGVSKASISAWCSEFSKESSAGRATGYSA